MPLNVVITDKKAEAAAATDSQGGHDASGGEDLLVTEVDSPHGLQSRLRHANPKAWICRFCLPVESSSMTTISRSYLERRKSSTILNPSTPGTNSAIGALTAAGHNKILQAREQKVCYAIRQSARVNEF